MSILTPSRKWLRALLPGNPGRMVFFSLLVGAVAGLGAILFFYALEWVTHTLFVQAANVPLIAPAGEILFEENPEGAPLRWLFFALPALGGLVSGILVYTFAPEAEGHGTDAMIDAFHRKRAIIRARVPFVKAVATIFTLGTGGSAGREGPIAQIGAGFGSWLARILGLTVRQRRTLLLAGTAGGLGAIFRAPLGGAITSVEVLYKEDFESEALVPAILSSVTAYALFSAVFGHERIFAIPEFTAHDARELLVYAVLGLVCIPVGILYTRMFYLTRDRVFRPLRIPRHVKPMIGGLGVGLLGLALPEAYGAGWGQIQLALFGKLSLGLMLALVLGKMVATSLTISSGGSGGVFGPTLFIGGMLGGAVGLAGNALLPELVTQPGAYVLVGMAAFFAGVANAPLGVLLMVCEMTGGYGLVAPLLVVSAIALVFTRKWSIYERQVPDKFHSDAHMAERTVNLLGDIAIRTVSIQRGPTVLREDMSLMDIRQVVAETDAECCPVLDGAGRLCGILRLSDARPVIFEGELDGFLIVADLMSAPARLHPDDSLYDALRVFNETGYEEIPVVDPNDDDRLLGTLRRGDLTAAYQKELAARRATDEEEGAGAPDAFFRPRERGDES